MMFVFVEYQFKFKLKWPLVVRYMVFPRVYGFYKNDRILKWLDALYTEYPIEGVVTALTEGLTEDEEEER
jgi:hypothetical protein